MIRRPSVMRTGFRYQLRRNAIFDDYGKYVYAQPADYADGCKMGDCWIVDKDGNVHPGYCNSPVPVYIDNLKNGVEIT